MRMASRAYHHQAIRIWDTIMFRFPVNVRANLNRSIAVAIAVVMCSVLTFTATAHHSTAFYSLRLRFSQQRTFPSNFPAPNHVTPPLLVMCYNIAVNHISPPVAVRRLERLRQRTASSFQSYHVCPFHHTAVQSGGECSRQVAAPPTTDNNGIISYGVMSIPNVANINNKAYNFGGRLCPFALNV